MGEHSPGRMLTEGAWKARHAANSASARGASDKAMFATFAASSVQRMAASLRVRNQCVRTYR